MKRTLIIMKNVYLIPVALLAAFLSACQAEQLPTTSKSSLKGFHIVAENTKAILDGVKVQFEQDDAVDIYADEGTTPFVYTYDAEHDIFNPSGGDASGSTYSVIFPSMETPSRTTVSIPFRQEATANSFPKNAMSMAGSSTTRNIQLRHLVGLWEMDLLPLYDQQKIVRASLSFNNAHKANGNFTLDWSDYSLTYENGGNNKLLLANVNYFISEGTAVKLYFALPPGDYDGGFTVRAEMTDGTAMEITSPTTMRIVRGQITRVKNEVQYSLFAAGSGSELDPYVIRNAVHWNNMVNRINADAAHYADAYYELDADIDFSNAAVTPIRNFTGMLDGKNHTLSNAQIGDGTSSHQAFFYLLKGTVKNLSFDSITVNAGNASSANSSAAVIVAGNSSSAFTLQNCHVTHSSVLSGADGGNQGGSYAAGLVARCNNVSASIKNCSVSGTTVTAAYANAGGLVGFFGAGTLDNVKSSENSVTTQSNSYAGGMVGGMSNGLLINAVSQNNICTVGRFSCGGVIGACTGATGKVINVLSEGNTVRSTLSQQNLYYLGGLIGGAGSSSAVATVANCLVLSGSATYAYTPATDTAIAGCIGIALGYNYISGDIKEYTVSNSFIHQAYRTKFDQVWLANENQKEYRRDAIGVKQNSYASESRGGMLGDFLRYLETPLTDGTVLDLLNDWVEANIDLYPTLKDWSARTSGITFPDINLGEMPAPAASESLQIVESEY